MLSTKRIQIILSLLVVTAMTFAAYVPALAEEPTGTLVRAISTFPNSLDLPIAAERQASTTAWMLYDTLVWVNDAGRVVPALAKSWEISEDGAEYTFHLRQDVVFHNGERFTADSVVFSWERGKNPEMQWSEKWALAESVKAVDTYTVKVSTGQPMPLFLRIMADNWAIVPPRYIAAVGEEGFAKRPIGTGPFMFVEWVKGDRIVMDANPNYWREGVPRIQRLIYRPIPESSTRVAAIQTGEVDIVTRLSAEEATSLLGVPGIKIIKYPLDRVWYVAFNNLTSGVGQPTEDARVRQAMNYAVDVAAIIDALFEGFARESTGYVTPANLGYDETLMPFGYDPEKARMLLADAGYPNGFAIDFACPIGAYTHFEEVCEAIQGYLGEVGIEIDLEFMESGHYWDLEANKQLPPLFGDSWSESTGEAFPRLQGALGGWDASFSSWSDPEIDRLLDAISVTVDQDARAALYVELQRYMHENPPFIYLYEPFTFEVISTRVQNYNPRAAENYFLFDTFVVAEN
ncbi:MAG: ABC transporter substrate-binding protein [Candidatus Bipolaricaulia bacterium]